MVILEVFGIFLVIWSADVGGKGQSLSLYELHTYILRLG